MSLELEHIQGFLVTLALSALIGIEREKHQREEGTRSLGGLRTFILVGSLGFLSMRVSIMLAHYFPFFLGVASVLALTVLAYLENRVNENSIGITTEIAGILTCFLGGLIACGDQAYAVAYGICIASVLALNKPLHRFVDRIKPSDFFAVLQLVVATFLILPLLPNDPIDPYGAIVPYKLWLLVIFISALSFIGYLINIFWGKAKGALATGLIGGLISSTAVTVALSRGEQAPRCTHSRSDFRAIGILIAWIIMLLRILILCGVTNVLVLYQLLLPILFMGMTCLCVITICTLSIRKINKKEVDEGKIEMDIKNPFNLFDASKFGLFFGLTLIGIRYLETHLSENAVYFVVGLAGLADVDAITLSLASVNDAVLNGFAKNGILIAIGTNTFAKCCIACMCGDKSLYSRVVISGVGILVVVAISIFL